VLQGVNIYRAKRVYAMVVMSDIAVYSQRNAQPTSGAGAIALLIGPQPKIIIHSERASNFMNALDFYKPHLQNDFPTVNGKLSTDLYIKSLIKCWQRFSEQRLRHSGNKVSLKEFDYYCFHSPFTKQVRKAFLALLFNELKTNPGFVEEFKLSPPESKKVLELVGKGVSFYNREIQKIIKPLFKKEVDTRLEDGLLLPALVGNIYTGSLYLSLISILYANKHCLDKLQGKRVMLYSYGSGLTSSLLHLEFSHGSLDNVINSPLIQKELNEANILSIPQYFEIRKMTIKLHGSKKHSSFLNKRRSLASLPPTLTDQLAANAYYLTSISESYVREYSFLTHDRTFIPFNQLRTNKLSSMPLSNTKTSHSPKLREMTIEQRQTHIAETFNNYSLVRHLKSGGLSQESADHMTENCIGRISLPLSVVTGLILNGKEYMVPMSTEEASVVAAANRSLKTIRTFGGGFWGYNSRNVIRGQIYVIDFQSLEVDTFLKKQGEGAEFNINRKFNKKKRNSALDGNMTSNPTEVQSSPSSLAINSGFESNHIFTNDGRPSSFVQNTCKPSSFKSQPNKKNEKIQKIKISVDIPGSIRNILRNKNKMLTLINSEFCKNMFKLGGGAFDIYCKIHDETSFSVSLLLDVVDAMGANTINTTLEKMKPVIMSHLVLNKREPESTQKINSSPILMSICSNLAPERVTRVGFKVPVSAFNFSKSVNGLEVCQRICMAARMAKLDLFRAVTHNKGIMNGIIAVLLALGQDTRAVEAGSHVYSVYRNGQYQSLSDYYLEESEDGVYLCGELEIPLSIGTVGGVLGMNPLYKSFLKDMEISSTKELSQVVACIGLANNLAALRALVTEGIQKGHMKLHAKNLALYVGVPMDMVDKAVEYMEKANKYNMDTAKEFLKNKILSSAKTFKELKAKL
jgi:degradative hydroxymethylglutaryl-CoA reductase